MKEFTAGTTVRLKCTFKDFNDEKVDPAIVKLIIYNEKYEKESEHQPQKKDVGEYFFDYVTDTNPRVINYEWYGEIDGLPSIQRDRFTTNF